MTIGCESTANAITLQIPFELTPPLGSATVPSGIKLGISDSAASGQQLYASQIAITLQSDAIHILRKGDTITSPSDARGGRGLAPAFLPPTITHADGSYVTSDNPAHSGETVSIWAVGLGLPSSGTVKTGDANPTPPLTTTVSLDFDFRSNAGPSMPSATNSGGSHVPAIQIPAYFAPGFVGLYQINVTIPQPPVPLESCGGVFQSNVTVNIGGAASYDGAGICVAQ